MICTYCGKERGDEYFCLNCKAPKEFFDGGRIVTQEQVNKDIKRLLEYCQDRIYPEDYKYTHKIIEAALFAGIVGSTVYVREIAGLTKRMLEMRAFAGATFESKISK